MSQKLRVLLVDDEPDACQNLRRILNDYVDPDIEIAGIAHNTRDAERLTQQLRPDALFLDIDMPGENAFQFLERLGEISFEVVFVTAYDAYAVRAFRLNAVDYILKPLNIDELDRTVRRLRERLAFRHLSDSQIYGALAGQINGRKEQMQIILRDNNCAEVVTFSRLLYAEAMGSYARVVFLSPEGVEKSMVLSHSIAEYEELFPSHLFFRIHRSYLVNRTYIRELLRNEDQNAVVLYNKKSLPVSRRRYADLLVFLKQKVAV